MATFSLVRDTKLFISTAQTVGAMSGTNTWEVPVLAGYSFTAETDVQTVTVSEAGVGSVALIPGFIAYPLCGILIKSGVAYSVIAFFITTLMMTGFTTLPVEAKFFGWRTSIIRNLFSLVAALFIGLLMSLFL